MYGAPSYSNFQQNASSTGSFGYSSPVRYDGSVSNFSMTNPNASRTVHEEATVEGVMNRWRVRPIYDNYSSTVAPSAPDTMSAFLSLRADLLKSSLKADETNTQNKQSSRREGALSSGGKDGSPASSSSSESDDDGLEKIENNSDNDANSNGESLSKNNKNKNKGDLKSDYEAKLRRYRARQQKKDDYTVRQLKGELERLIEQLQISNAESVQLRSQIAGMTKELSSRQRRIGDLEERNRLLTEQNDQLQQSVAELGLTVNTIEESNHAQLLQTRAGVATSVMGGEVASTAAASPASAGGAGEGRVGGTFTAPTASSRQRGVSLAREGGGKNGGANVHWQ